MSAVPACASPVSEAAVKRASHGRRRGLGRNENGPAGSGRKRIPSSSIGRVAMRSAWLAVTMHAVPAEAPMPTVPRSSSTTSCPSRASA